MKSFFESGEGLNNWLGQRRWRIFAFCVPALMAGVIVTTMLGIVLSRRSSELQDRYNLLDRNALLTGNFEIARVLSLRGLSGAKNERDRSRWIFYLARAMNGLGHLPEAEALVFAAAPLDPLGAGDLEAHLAVAENLLTATDLRSELVREALANPTNALAGTLDQIKRHLLSAVAISPNSLRANELLGRYYIHTREPEKARACLLKIYAIRPETALLLAIASDMEGKPPDAIEWADRALTVYEHNLLQSAPQYNPEDRLGLVRAIGIQRKYLPLTVQPDKSLAAAPNMPVQDSPGVWLGIVQLLMINDKYAAALQTLEQRMVISSNAAYPPKMAELCSILAGSIRQNSRGGELARLHFIQEGLTNAPDNLELQLLLVESAHARDDSGKLAQVLMDHWSTNATGGSAAIWQFVLWTDWRVRGDLVEARKHLHKAHELAPDNPMVIGDMAVDLASEGGKSLDKALRLVEPLVDKYPYDPTYRDTRGQILTLLGRYQDALPDLRYAAQRFDNAPDTERALAKVDAALGLAREDDSSGRLEQVQTLTGDGNYAGALKILELALEDGNNPAYAVAYADVCGTWVENLPLSKRDQRLQLIEKGLGHDPKNSKLQTLLLQATRSGDDSGKAAQKFLDKLVADAEGEAAADWHLALGRDARERGDLVTAKTQLEMALRMGTQRAEVQIELTTVLAGGNHDDLEEGLQLINSVLDKFPNNAEFRGLRGRIFAGLGQNNDAVSDLSFAAERLENQSASAALRKVLVTVYEKMGQKRKADEQRRLLEEQ